MPRVLRFTLIGCGGLVVLVVLVGMVAACGTEPSSPPERAEQDEGVEGGGKEPEATKPLEGEKTKPQEQQPKPEEGTLYELAVSEPLPPYKIDFTASDTDQRGISRPQDGDGDGRARCDIGAYERRTPQ